MVSSLYNVVLKKRKENMVRFIFLILVSCWSLTAVADKLRVAVASNFLPAVKEINLIFEAEYGQRVSISSASTSKLTAQLLHGAPFDVLLGANEEEPKQIVKAFGLNVDHYAVYTTGRLALVYDSGLNVASLWKNMAESGSRIAIANPRLAPYGKAAREVLQHKGLWSSVTRRLVKGENVGQAFQYVRSGQTGFGFVALSQVRALEQASFQYIEIPRSWHSPVRQAMVRVSESTVAKQYFDFLLSSRVQKMLTEDFGYAGVRF